MGFFVNHLSLVVVVCLNFIPILAQYPYEMTVSAPVANLVREPGIDHQSKRGPVLSRNVLQLDTQLLFGQRVQVQEECFVGQEAWVKVKALEQKKAIFDADGTLKAFIAYPGWMRKTDLREPVKVCEELDAKNTSEQTINTSESALLLQEENTRKKIVDYAYSFLGSPYVWGGCSEYKAEANYLTGVDCSGLIYLCYRNSNIEIPRDAHDQFYFTNEIVPKDIQLGDLVFFGVERQLNNKVEIRINHVLMYAGKGFFIEAFAGNPSCSDINDLSHEERTLACVRKISLEERLGKSLNELRNGDFLSKTKCFIYFRSVFPLKTN